jgi:hypothetical protein
MTFVTFHHDRDMRDTKEMVGMFMSFSNLQDSLPKA